jgi:transcriptional regulator with XRE-family HTH domain
MSLGKTIVKLRNRQGWTQAELAEKLEMATAHINRLEHDRMQPRAKTMEKLAEVFGLSRQELVAGTETATDIVAGQDPELAELWGQVSILDNDQRHALRTFLRSMIACQQIQRITSRSGIG